MTCRDCLAVIWAFLNFPTRFYVPKIPLGFGVLIPVCEIFGIVKSMFLVSGKVGIDELLAYCLNLS